MKFLEPAPVLKGAGRFGVGAPPVAGALQLAANGEAASAEGYTPLHLAAMQGHEEVIEMLVQAYDLRPFVGAASTASATRDLSYYSGVPEGLGVPAPFMQPLVFPRPCAPPSSPADPSCAIHTHVPAIYFGEFSHSGRRLLRGRCVSPLRRHGRRWPLRVLWAEMDGAAKRCSVQPSLRSASVCYGRGMLNEQESRLTANCVTLTDFSHVMASCKDEMDMNGWCNGQAPHFGD
ncbi:hypothetical protein CAPTEDRAFT_188678 [Capitella teleta]|uniref:Uncharacterized protein n=1 Tax=Capitella teleta TaxID=283909 RepID=R7U1K0_CAPTE|nr:hypothetical protein CAPTEDRAFT_188678 [Capitella teleta]|eukprot:ELU00104.1 hypothetical protein CAPTEDRAFT_188678 [Capitella teleta]